MKKPNSSLLSRSIVFEGGVNDYKALLKAVEFALVFARAYNSSFAHNEPEKMVRMAFTVSCDGSSNFHFKVLDDPR